MLAFLLLMPLTTLISPAHRKVGFPACSKFYEGGRHLHTCFVRILLFIRHTDSHPKRIFATPEHDQPACLHRTCSICTSADWLPLHVPGCRCRFIRCPLPGCAVKLGWHSTVLPGVLPFFQYIVKTINVYGQRVVLCVPDPPFFCSHHWNVAHSFQCSCLAGTG